MNFRAKKLSLKSLALSGLFGAKWFGANCTTGVVDPQLDNRDLRKIEGMNFRNE